MLGFGAASGFTAAPKTASRQVTASSSNPSSTTAQFDRSGAKIR
jgi:hypothetical protein